METSFSGGRSRSARREPQTMGKQLVNLSNNMFQQYYILFPFCPADSTIVAFVPLAVEDDICMIH
jgi:hypothetical protein